MYNNQCGAQPKASEGGRGSGRERESAHERVQMERARGVAEKRFCKWQTKVVILKNTFFGFEMIVAYDVLTRPP